MFTIETNSKIRLAAVSALAALVLSACGGGGGGDDAPAPVPAPPPPSVPAPPPNPPAPAPLSWAPASTLAADQFHTVASNDSGTVLVAGTIRTTLGALYLSTNSGATFAATSAPIGQWISVDMTPAGDRIVAAQFGGGVYLSTDTGATWNRIDGGTNEQYESVTISEDGSRIVAAVMNGPILVSSNANTATPTFAQATRVGGGTLADSFRSVDSSADGMTVVAGSHNGDLYLSTDGGATFSVLPVVVGGATVNDGWYRVAISDDGNRIAAVGNSEFGTGVPEAQRSTGLYVGNLSGGVATWTRASDVAGAYSSLSMTGSGGVIGATQSNTPAGAIGQVLLSSDGGQSFRVLAAPAGETNWRAMALNADASRAILAAGTFTTIDGQVYLSSGSLLN